MQCLDVSGAVRPIYGSLGVKLLNTAMCTAAVLFRLAKDIAVSPSCTAGQNISRINEGIRQKKKGPGFTCPGFTCPGFT